MDLAQTSSPTLHDISLAIAEVLGDFREEPEPLVRAVAVGPLVVPSGACPKCIAVRAPAARACPCCGLEFERFHAGLVAPSAPLLEAFAALQSSGFEDHARLLTRAQLLGELPQVVRLYRIALARDPGNQTARGVLDEAVRLASAGLVAVPVPAKERSNRNLVMAAVLVMFLATVALQTISALH